MSFLFGKDHQEEELGIIERLIRVNEKMVAEIIRLKPQCPSPRFVAFFSIHINNSKFLIMSLTLVQGQQDVVGIEVFDSITGNVLDKAVTSSPSYSVDDATLVSASPDADGKSEDLTAVAPGLANLSGSITADLSAYGLGNAVVLAVSPVPVNVTPPVQQIAPAARFVFAAPTTPAPAQP